MPDEHLLVARSVTLDVSVEWLLSRPSARALCLACGEEIINSRQVVIDGKVLCRPCAGDGYLQPLATHFASASLEATVGAIAEILKSIPVDKPPASEIEVQHLRGPNDDV